MIQPLLPSPPLSPLSDYAVTCPQSSPILALLSPFLVPRTSAPREGEEAGLGWAVAGMAGAAAGAKHEREPQALSDGARGAAVSWTGGKDCNLALLTAWRDPALRVSALVVFRPASAVFRAHPLHIMQRQADALSLPLLQVEITGEPSYKASYVAGMRRLKEVLRARVNGMLLWLRETRAMLAGRLPPKLKLWSRCSRSTASR